MDLIRLGLIVMQVLKWVTSRIDKDELRSDTRAQVFAESIAVAQDNLGIHAEVEAESIRISMDRINKELEEQGGFSD